MAAEICLSKLPQLIADPNAEFQVFYLLLSPLLRNTSVVQYYFAF